MVGSAVGPGLGSIVALGLAYANADALRGSGFGLAALFMLIGALACGLTLLPTNVLALVSGWAFGFPVGFAVAYLGSVLGAPVGYRAGGLLAGSNAQALAAKHRRAGAIFETIKAAPTGRAAGLIALLRMSPVVPYGSTNVLCAVTEVPLRALVIGTLLGQGPRAGVVVALGAGLESLDGEKSANPWMLGLGIGATVLAVVLMGWAAKRALQRASHSAAASMPMTEQVTTDIRR